MKSMKVKVAKAVAKTAKHITSGAVNSSCYMFAYQSQLPKSANNLRKK